MKNKIMLLLLVFIFLTGLFISTSYSAEKKIVIRITHEVTTTGDLHLVLEEFKRLAEKELPGRLDIRIYPLGELFKDRESFDQIRMRNVELGGGTMGTLAAVIDSRLAILDLPFLFPSFESMRGLLKSDFGKELEKMIEAKGLKILGVGRSTRLGLVTKKGPTRHPNEIKGMVIRGFSPIVHKPMLSAWGASYTYLSAAEISHALETGVIDGVWTSVLGWMMTKDPGNYFTVFPAAASPMYKVVSLDWWRRLPGDVRTGLTKAMDGALDYNWNVVSGGYEKKAFEQYPWGKGKYQAYFLGDNETGVWREKSMAVYTDLEGTFGKELMASARKFSMTGK